MDRRQLIVDQSIIIQIKLSHLLDVIYGNGVLLSDSCCCARSANHVKNAQVVYFFYFFQQKHAHTRCSLFCTCKYNLMEIKGGHLKTTRLYDSWATQCQTSVVMLLFVI